MKRSISMNIPNRSDLATLVPAGGIGIELGVATGLFSSALLQHGAQIGCLYSVDRWSDHHNVSEYFHACQNLRVYGERSVVLRATFEEALPLFPDASFDFIYIDAYAHTGQEGGRILDQWWPKLKEGGVFAGHDYDPAWPATIEAVDVFAAAHQIGIAIIPGDAQADRKTEHYASWWCRKPGVRSNILEPPHQPA